MNFGRIQFSIPTAMLALAATAVSSTAGAAPPDLGEMLPCRPLVGLGTLLVALFILIIFKAATIALALAASETAPAAFGRGRVIFATSPLKSFFVGLVNFIFALAVGVILIQSGKAPAAAPAAILGFLLLEALIVVFLVASGAVRVFSFRMLLVILALLLVWFITLDPKGEGRALIGSIVLLILLLLAWTSRAIMYQWLGMRLTGEPVGLEGVSSPRAHIWGGVTAELGFLTPFVGWLVAGVVTLTTFGALVLALLRRRRAAALAETSTELPE